MAAPTAANFTDVIVEVPPEASELIAACADYSFLRMETAKPMLLIGNTVYEGEYKDAVGTDLIFDQSRKSAAGYLGASTKRLVFHLKNDSSPEHDTAPGDKASKNNPPQKNAPEDTTSASVGANTTNVTQT